MMKNNSLSERLERYTHMLVFRGAAKARLAINPILPEEKQLFQIIDTLWETMQPVAPNPEFQETLHQQLMQEAQRELTRRHLGIRKEQSHRSPWLTSAAMVGAAATLAGAYAYWRWNASRQAA